MTGTLKLMKESLTIVAKMRLRKKTSEDDAGSTGGGGAPATPTPVADTVGPSVSNVRFVSSDAALMGLVQIFKLRYLFPKRFSSMAH